MPSEQLHEPWRSFLRAIDTQLSGSTEIHCLGGFVVAEYYGLVRPTSDVDIIQVRGASTAADVLRIGGKGSALAKKHRVYIDIVTVADVPERYEERLIDVYAEEFRDLRIRVFERHDLALAKLGRNQDSDARTSGGSPKVQGSTPQSSSSDTAMSCAGSSGIQSAKTGRSNYGSR